MSEDIWKNGFIQETRHSGGGIVMMWSCISRFVTKIMPYKITNLIIENHVKNNRASPGTMQAIFILRPLSTSSVLCPLASSIS